MGKPLRIAGIALAAVAGLGAGYLFVRKPTSVPPPDIKVQISPERIARGQYLFALADCGGCHSPRDFTRFGGPEVAGMRGAGASFPPELGLPGEIHAPNITPDVETGLGAWTDGEKIRAIRDGVSRDGRALFPMMPYAGFRNMSDYDVESLVAYLNTLAPVKHHVPRSAVVFPVSLLIKSAPKPAGPVAPPDRANRVEYGRYLVNLGGCMDCHTGENKGEPVPGMLLAGGRTFHVPGAAVRSANITPDGQTGIGRWSERDFIDRFHQYREYAAKGSPPSGPESFTLMPWLNLCQLPEDDLKAIYAFLKTQKPVYNAVETHPNPVASIAQPGSAASN